MDYNQAALELHAKLKGKIELGLKTTAKTRDDLATVYTPGVGAVCRAIAEDKSKVWDLTSRGNWVAVITDGSAVLGLGNIGPEAGMPVMEGKALLFKQFANVDAFPICLATQDPDEIIKTIKYLAPSFAGINLEDIAAPQCFYIEERLKAELDIPVFHDDQHGTAIVVLAGLKNALKVVSKELSAVRIVISGAGAAGIAIAKLLVHAGAQHVILSDSKGLLSASRTDLNDAKKAMLEYTNKDGVSGSLADGLTGADVFIGVSGPGVVSKEMVASMNSSAIVFAMSNPIPEILPEEAKAGGAAVIATGRSDYANQINNALVFPGLFRGLLDARAKDVSNDMKVAIALALADLVASPSAEQIIPELLDPRIVTAVADAVKKTASVVK